MPDDVAEPLNQPPWLTSWVDCRQSGLAAFYKNDRWAEQGRELDTKNFEYRSAGYVSVWIGNFVNEWTFDLYFEEATDSFDLTDGEEDFCPLWDDLGFRLAREWLSSFFFPAKTRIDQMVDRLPQADVFKTELLSGCNHAGIAWGNAILAIWGLDYTGSSTLANGSLKFVGSARYS